MSVLFVATGNTNWDEKLVYLAQQWRNCQAVRDSFECNKIRLKAQHKPQKILKVRFASFSQKRPVDRRCLSLLAGLTPSACLAEAAGSQRPISLLVIWLKPAWHEKWVEWLGWSIWKNAQAMRLYILGCSCLSKEYLFCVQNWAHHKTTWWSTQIMESKIDPQNPRLTSWWR